MNAIDTDVVAAISREIAAQVGDLRYSLWFRDNAKLLLQEQELVVGVPNLFFQEWLSSNFMQVLGKAVQIVLGKSLPVRFKVDGEMFRKMRRQRPIPSYATQDSGAAQGPAPDASKPPRPLTPRRGAQTLDNFVVGPCNKAAHCAALQAADLTASQFSPLLFYGPIGVGKTHLLRGICQAARQRFPGSSVVLLNAESFTNSFLEGLRSKQLSGFRDRVRSADILLIDDIHFFGSKWATLSEVQHTFEALDSRGKQLVMTSTRHPGYLPELNTELSSRLIAGLCCSIEPPDLETRKSILRTRAARLDMHLSESVIDFVARQLNGNARELIGALSCLKAQHGACCQDVAAASESLQELIKCSSRPISIADVESAVCRVLDVTAKQLRSPCRCRSIAYPRMLAMFLCRKHTGATYESIGAYFGNRNHSTVMFAERRVQQWLDNSAVLQLSQNRREAASTIQCVEDQLIERH